jgi:Protein of unknown function (DUF2778)
MLGIDATFDDVSLDGGGDPRRVPLPIVPGAVALALFGCVSAWILHLHVRPAAAPAIVNIRPATAPTAAPAAEVASNPYGEIIIDPSFLAELNPTSPAENLSPPPTVEAVPPAPSLGVPQSETVPLPPKREVPQIVDSAPLPPPRPSEFGSPAIPAAPDRRSEQKNGGVAGPAAAVDNRNFIQKLFGYGQQPTPAVGRPAPEGRVASAAPDGRIAYPAPVGRVANAAPDGRGVGRAPFGAFPPAFGASTQPQGRLGRAFFGGSAPVTGYDRFTAVYDISARTVYLPDGTRLEAHSGLGDRLDDPRFVSERMRGATPPDIYELEPREASFHGVQALRLNPVGDNDIFGRAGLLAHSYMLGPNGDSNGCVSFKDYDAFLRAYQNGQIKRLAVVARLG